MDSAFGPVDAAITVLLCATAITACGGLAGDRDGSALPRMAAATSPARRIIGQRLPRQTSVILRVGTRVSPGFAGVRIFADRRRGFAITELPNAADGTYPVATHDGGATWRIDGPVLHVAAAQGAVAVGQAGVAGPRFYFAWCGACNSVIDATPDAGRHWWQTFMPGDVLAVTGNTHQGLTAIIARASRPGIRSAKLLAYRSHDGRRWTYDRTVIAVG